MGFFDFLRGVKKPDSNTPVLSLEDLKKNILGLNRDTAPYHITTGEEEGVDLLAEWKIVDASWYEIFNKSGLKEVFKILMVFDDEKKEVRMMDKSFRVEWEAGVAKLSVNIEAFKGQKVGGSFGTAYAFTEEFKPGEVYNYRFNTSEIKKPLDQAILASGWSIKKVTFSSLKKG